MTYSAPEIECRQCQGFGFTMPAERMGETADCAACDGEGWRPMTADELDAEAERQAEDAMSEPPVTMAEQHRAAWQQKKDLRS